MFKISCGQGIFPLSMKTDFQQLARSHPTFEAIAANDVLFGEDRERVGYTPSPGEVLDLVDEAFECHENSHGDAAWTMMVQNILRLSLRTLGAAQLNHLANFMPCPTAATVCEYLPAASSSDTVDFCMYMEPNADADPMFERSSSIPGSPALRRVRRQLPGGALNHTTYYPLRNRPIALGIRTRKSSEGWKGASVHWGSWELAHWNFLRCLASIVPAAEQNEEEYETEPVIKEEEEEEEEEQHEVAQTLPSPRVVRPPLPPFIPGIIIEKHNWYLSVSTENGDEVVMGSRIMVGATNSLRGIYQIILGLQTLREWAEDMYWPIVKNLIVGAQRNQAQGGSQLVA
ncbi:hypothetical protein QQX98_007108 [Neonectria punicea]|uniref:PD-(D/E)XK nuclease-like domain-containing protein n=1 Tax=Neonectria punicea TaxID=979145 RepID=A0ABR1GYU9_9HYPO